MCVREAGVRRRGEVKQARTGTNCDRDELRVRWLHKRGETGHLKNLNYYEFMNTCLLFYIIPRILSSNH